MSKVQGYTPYLYGNMPIPGGGYVTGFAFHARVPNILYARTDIGGVYRYEFETDSWHSLVEHVRQDDLSETFPLAIALDDEHPERLYVTCGVGNGRHPSPARGWFCISEDYGETFRRLPMPCPVHGNDAARGTGPRLLADPNREDTLYFASQTAGLLRTTDLGESWQMLSVCSEAYPIPEGNLSFLWLSPDSRCLVVSTAGIDNRVSDTVRGHSLFVSYDEGETFTELAQPTYDYKATEPLPPGESYAKFEGAVGHRYAFDGRYLYVTFSESGRYSWRGIEGYGCDASDLTGGRIYRYPYAAGVLGTPTDITPHKPELGMAAWESTSDLGEATSHRRATPSDDKLSDEANNESRAAKLVHCGYGGISTCDAVPGLVACATICRHAGDMLFQSEDYGDTWTLKLLNLEDDRVRFRASYMKPEYNGGTSLIHWASDVRYHPFDPNMLLFTTGTGVFMSTNLQQPDYYFSDHCDGIEETVHLNVYAPTGGRTICLDIVGDLGGFAFSEVGKECENSFANEQNDRYITAINADYADLTPHVLVATPRGNWTGLTKGGLIVSTDSGLTWQRPELPYGISERLDELFERICRPNNNSGWVALSADARSLVWAVANGGDLHADCVVYSHDLGEHYGHTQIYDKSGQPVGDLLFKPFADRTNPDLFYGFCESSRFFVSRDGGETFYEKDAPANLPKQHLAGIDAANTVEIRGVSGCVGEFYFAMNIDGLWKVRYDATSDAFTATRITDEGEPVWCVGLGIVPGETDYLSSEKALYICAALDGAFGFYRSYDGGKCWSKLNNEHQHFGEIKSIDGDKRVAGRYFIATGTRGLKYGEEA